jgi:hypothetical protein
MNGRTVLRRQTLFLEPHRVYCGRCGEAADPREGEHKTTDAPGTPGCGVRWRYVSGDLGTEEEVEEHLEGERTFLPLVVFGPREDAIPWILDKLDFYFDTGVQRTTSPGSRETIKIRARAEAALLLLG